MSVNKVILVGNLGKDPELRTTPSQVSVGTFTLATSERRKDQSGNWGDHTEWHNIVCFGNTAENCQKFIKKGRQVYVEGKIQTRKWQDKEGKDRYTTEIVADRIVFLGSARGDSDRDSGGSYMPADPQSYTGSGFGDSGSIAVAPVAFSMQGLKPADQMGAPSKNEVTFEDDDIPF